MHEVLQQVAIAGKSGEFERKVEIRRDAGYTMVASSFQMVIASWTGEIIFGCIMEKWEKEDQ